MNPRLFRQLSLKDLLQKAVNSSEYSFDARLDPLHMITWMLIHPLPDQPGVPAGELSQRLECIFSRISCKTRRLQGLVPPTFGCVAESWCSYGGTHAEEASEPAMLLVVIPLETLIVGTACKLAIIDRGVGLVRVETARRWRWERFLSAVSPIFVTCGCV